MIKKILWAVLFLSISYKTFRKLPIDSNITYYLNQKTFLDSLTAFELMGVSKNTKFVKILLHDSYDYSANIHSLLNSNSVYHTKIKAMENLTGLLPPYQTGQEPDTLNIFFYVRWATKQKIISKNDSAAITKNTKKSFIRIQSILFP